MFSGTVAVAGSKYTIGIFDSAGQVSTLLKKNHNYILVVFDSLTGIFFEPKLIITHKLVQRKKLHTLSKNLILIVFPSVFLYFK